MRFKQGSGVKGFKRSVRTMNLLNLLSLLNLNRFTTMRFRTWPVAALGLGGLLLLVVVSVLAASSRAQEIYTQLDQLNTLPARRRDEAPTTLRSDVHLSGIFIRDYLLDPRARARPASIASALAKFRQNNVATVAELRALASGRPDNEERISSLRSQARRLLAGVRSALRLDARRENQPERQLPAPRGAAAPRGRPGDRLGDRRAEQRQPRDPARRGHAPAGGVPQRAAPAAVGQPCARPRRRADRRDPPARARAPLGERARGRGGSRAADAPALAAAGGDAGGRAQEPVARAPRSRRPDADGAAHGARAASTRSATSARSAGRRRGRHRGAVAECRQLVDDMVRTVRDLALGLRPSMLDDFGLQPALEWHVRDFGRRFGVPVELSVDGDLELLPEQHRTCVYRSVQEALTNCVRHARASRIAVSVSRHADGLDRHGRRRRRRVRSGAAARAVSACAASRSACASCTAS